MTAVQERGICFSLIRDSERKYRALALVTPQTSPARDGKVLPTGSGTPGQMAAEAYDVVVGGGTAGTFAAATAATEGARCRPPRAQERGGGWPHRLWRRAQGPGGVSRRRRPRSPHFGGILEPPGRALGRPRPAARGRDGKRGRDVDGTPAETADAVRCRQSLGRPARVVPDGPQEHGNT